MIKLKIEIKDDKFQYKYNVGGSKEIGTMPLDPFKLNMFSNMLEACRKSAYNRDIEKIKELTAEVGARSWIEKHPDEAMNILERKNNKT